MCVAHSECEMIFYFRMIQRGILVLFLSLPPIILGDILEILEIFWRFWRFFQILFIHLGKEISIRFWYGNMDFLTY